MEKSTATLALLGLTFSATLFAAPAITLDTTLTDNLEHPQAKTTFSKDTPMIYITWKSDQLKQGQTLKASWIADDTHNVAPANYQIDAAELKLDEGFKGTLYSHIPGSFWEGKFSMNMPNKGWPAGKYHVAITVDGEPVKNVGFTIGEAPKADANKKWGALAIDVAANKEESLYGIGGGDSKDEAIKNAQSFCLETGAKKCDTVLTYQQCGAFALGDQTHKAAAMAENKELAEANAVKACNFSGCAVVISDCN